MVDFFIDHPNGRRERFRRSLGEGVTSKRQAAKEEERLKAEAHAAVKVEATGGATSAASLPPAAFSGFAKMWLDLHVKVNCSPATQERYEGILRVHAVPYFGDREIASIRALDIEKFKAESLKALVPNTGKPLGPKSVNEHLCVISSMFKSGVDWGYLLENPARKVKRLKVPPPKLAAYDAEQTRAFLETAKRLEPELYPLFVTGFRTGLRLGELFALEWGHIDFLKRQIHVVQAFSRSKLKPPKDNEARFVPMVQSLHDVLRGSKHLKGQWVFCHRDGRRLNRNNIKHAFERVAKAAGLPRIRHHDMRHSFASQLVMAGVPLKAVSQYLGHSETKITERYAHLAPSAAQKFIDVLDGGSMIVKPMIAVPDWWSVNADSRP
ncbi:MAG: hypothetical protein AMXMBFR64_39350 [Myxococcales bacterium]